MTAPASGDKAAKTRGELLTGPVFPMVVKFGVPTMVSMLTSAIYNLTGPTSSRPWVRRLSPRSASSSRST